MHHITLAFDDTMTVLKEEIVRAFNFVIEQGWVRAYKAVFWLTK